MKRTIGKATLVGVLGLVATWVVLGLLVPASAPAEAARPGAACPNPGVFTGTDANGNFQAALDDAIAQAEACAPCCDFITTYSVIETTGRRGGFAGFNDIYVEIRASY